MAISSYSDLTTAIADWTHRADLTSKMGDFISLAEVAIYNGTEYSSPLRVTSMQNRDSGTISSGSITIPTGYLETIRLAGTTGGQNYQLEYIAPADFSQYENQSGNPRYYTVLNGAIKTAPNGGVDYVHDYYKQFDALTAVATTNWIITYAPNIYLFGCLVEAYKYMGNPNLQAAKQEFADAISGANKADKRKMQAVAMRVMVA